MSSMLAIPPPIEPGTLLTRWSWTPFALLGCGAGAAWYLAASRRVVASGTPVSSRRTAAFLSGIAVLVIALASPIDTYADVSFTVHMVQHLLLSFVAPPLLALGAPIALALRASSPRTRSRLRGWLRGRTARALANPVVGFVAFATLPFVVHFSPLFDLALRNAWVHAGEHLLLLAVGAIYWWPLVGADPIPHRPSHAARVLSMLLMLPAQSFLALAISSASAPLYATYAALPAPFGPNALADQRAAAAVMWVVGAILTISFALLAADAWRRAERGAVRRLEDARPGMPSGVRGNGSA
jgi:putative membrane protein